MIFGGIRTTYAAVLTIKVSSPLKSTSICCYGWGNQSCLHKLPGKLHPWYSLFCCLDTYYLGRLHSSKHLNHILSSLNYIGVFLGLAQPWSGHRQAIVGPSSGRRQDVFVRPSSRRQAIVVRPSSTVCRQVVVIRPSSSLGRRRQALSSGRRRQSVVIRLYLSGCHHQAVVVRPSSLGRLRRVV